MGVVVCIDPPVEGWVDGMRRGLGDPSVDRISPHVTLVPPLNLRAADLDAALERLRAAAAGVAGPLRLTLGPAATFAPANPVVYLAVGGDVEALASLRHAVFGPPLERTLAWPWVPHVTVADDVDPDRVEAVVATFERAALVADVDRVTLLEERHDGGRRRWEPLADVTFGPPTVLGRGGLPLVVTGGRTPDPAASALLGAVPTPTVRPGAPATVVLTGHREGRLAGVAAAWLADDGGRVRVVVAPEVRASGVGAHLLAVLEDRVRTLGWDCAVLHAEGPAAFYRARSSWCRPVP